MTIDRTQITRHVIDIGILFDPVEIKNYFRDQEIALYVYEFRFVDSILKYGMSMKTARPSDLGERVYRQVQNIPGWAVAYRSPAGKDFQYICDDFLNAHKIAIHKNNVKLVIHDMTNYKFSVKDKPELEVKKYEAELIRDYKLLHGHSPIGNLRDETKSLIIKVTSDVAMEAAGFDMS